VQNAGNAMWAEAVDNLSRAAQIAEQLKDRRQWEEAVCHKAHLEFYRGNFKESRKLYGEASSSAESRDDKQIINRCKAGEAAVLLATDEVVGALDILRTTNSYGQHALALLRSGRKEQALEKALKVKDRFKGKRTKYYVLKAFSSTAEVILKLLEDAVTAHSRQQKLNRQFSLLGGFNVSKFTGNFGLRESSSRNSIPSSTLTDTAEVRLNDRSSLEELAQDWIFKLEEFGKIYPVAKPRAALLRGQYLMLSDRHTLAHSCFRRSLNIARSLQMPYEEGLALYELGKAAKSYHDAQRYIQHALKNFELVGAAYDVGRCKQQQARLVDGKMLASRATDYAQNLRSDTEPSEHSDRESDEMLPRTSRAFSACGALPTVGEEDETTSGYAKEGDDEKTSHGDERTSPALRVALPVIVPSLPTALATTAGTEATAATPATPPTAAACSPGVAASSGTAAVSVSATLPQPALLPSFRKSVSFQDEQARTAAASTPGLVCGGGSCAAVAETSRGSATSVASLSPGERLLGGSLLPLSERRSHDVRESVQI